MVKKKKHNKKNSSSRLRIKIMLVALFPMILMLGVVMAIVMLPACLSFYG